MSAGQRRKPRAQHDHAYRAFCDLLRKIREDNELTQRELATRLSRQHSYVWKTEKAERRMDAIELVRWCGACGADPALLFSKVIRLAQES